MGITNASAVVVSCVLGRCQSTGISIFNGLPKRAQRTLQLMKFKLPAEPPVEASGSMGSSESLLRRTILYANQRVQPEASR